MSKQTATGNGQATGRILPDLTAFAKLKVAKATAAAPKAKTIPEGPENAALIGNDTVAVYRQGDFLFCVVNISAEARKAAEVINDKDGNPTKNKLLASTGQGRFPVAIGDGVKLNLWVGETVIG